MHAIANNPSWDLTGLWAMIAGVASHPQRLRSLYQQHHTLLGKRHGAQGHLGMHAVQCSNLPYPSLPICLPS